MALVILNLSHGCQIAEGGPLGGGHWGGGGTRLKTLFVSVCAGLQHK